MISRTRHSSLVTRHSSRIRPAAVLGSLCQALGPVAGLGTLVLGFAEISDRTHRSSLVTRHSSLVSRHPLDALTAAEIQAAVEILRGSVNLARAAALSQVSLQEPPKEEVLRYQPGASFRREAFAILFDRETGRVFEAVVDLNARRVLSWKPVPGVQPPLLAQETAATEELIRADPRWQAAVRRRGIMDLEHVALDLWTGCADGGSTGVSPARLGRVLSYYRGSIPNYWARPLEGVLVLVDIQRQRVIEVIDTGAVPVRREGGEYVGPAAPPLRAAPQPLLLSQPQGPSFLVRGHEVRWQKWRFRFGIHPREGAVLYTVGYEDQGRLRPVLYRAALSEMVVPYADPDPLWSFRSTFDAGELGLGRFASSLVAGSDAPENAVYFDAAFVNEGGQVYVRPRVAALYERDGGRLWRHGAEGGAAESRRARDLVLSLVGTFGNYDYGFNWVFHQDGSLEVETELTGIMLARGVRSTKSGTDHDARDERHGHLVAPNLAAVSHQHFFNFRLDLDVDGPAPNRVYELDNLPLPLGAQNPSGNAFAMRETLLATETEARRDLDLAAGRRWKVASGTARNAIGRPTGYLLFPGENAVAYAAPGSAIRRGAGFVDHHLWITRYDPGEMNAAGAYVRRDVEGVTRDGPDGLPRWTADNASLKDQDVVLWYTMGVNHVPRPEEWPVMPVHRAGFRLLPADFFDRNPALDVPAQR